MEDSQLSLVLRHLWVVADDSPLTTHHSPAERGASTAAKFNWRIKTKDEGQMTKDK
jgi:hypothetical protein